MRIRSELRIRHGLLGLKIRHRKFSLCSLAPHSPQREDHFAFASTRARRATRDADLRARLSVAGLPGRRQNKHETPRTTHRTDIRGTHLSLGQIAHAARHAATLLLAPGLLVPAQCTGPVNGFVLSIIFRAEILRTEFRRPNGIADSSARSIRLRNLEQSYVTARLSMRDCQWTRLRRVPTRSEVVGCVRRKRIEPSWTAAAARAAEPV